MKKAIFQFLCIVVVLMSTSMVLGADIKESSIQIIKTQVTPEPVEPGNDLTLQVLISNSGELSVDQVTITPQIKSPFYFKGSDFNRQGFNICVGCSYNAAYYLSVDSNAVSAVYPIEFAIEYQDGILEKETIFVNVIGVPDILLIHDLHEVHYPDEFFDVNFTLSNIGTGNAKSIKITSLSEDFYLTGTQTKLIESLSANKQIQLNLGFLSDSNLVSGTYKVPFQIKYLDELGDEHTKEYDLSVSIKDESKVALQDLKVDGYESIIFDEILITGIIENTGTGEAHNVFVTIKTQLEGYTKSFIGSLGADEDSPFFFRLKSSESGDFPIALTINYEDDKGMHVIQEDLNVKVTKPISRLYLVLAIAVILMGFFIYRVAKRRKGD